MIFLKKGTTYFILPLRLRYANTKKNTTRWVVFFFGAGGRTDSVLRPLTARHTPAPPWYRSHRSALKMCHWHIFLTVRPKDSSPTPNQKIRARPKGRTLILVPVAGLEPARYRYRWILSPLRLPIPSHRHMVRKILYRTKRKKSSTFPI